MNPLVAQSSVLVGVVGIVAFAIQQSLQLIDPLVEAYIGWYKARRTERKKLPLPNAMSDAEFKKSVMGAIAFGLGTAVSATTNIRILESLFISPEAFAIWPRAGIDSLRVVFDIVVSGFVIGAGTDGVNTLLKYAGYTKDARGLAAGASPTPARLAPAGAVAAPIGQTVRAANVPGLDYPVAYVGVQGNISVYCDSDALGGQGLALAQALLGRVTSAPAGF